MGVLTKIALSVVAKTTLLDETAFLNQHFKSIF